MERNSHPRLDSCLLYFTALWLCMELGATASDESQTVCCAVSHLGVHPKSCGLCPLGKCCEDNQCHRCRKLPQCKEGEELYCSGTIDFSYSCQPCPRGTFSDTKNGCCIPWDDCEKQELQILRAGNGTHNVQCGPIPTTVVMPSDFTVASIFTVLTAAGVFVLLLMTFVLIVCTWTQKKEKFPLEEDHRHAKLSTFVVQTGMPVNQDEPESPELPNPLESNLLQEDTYSCQFPEEEHGGKMVE